MSTTFRSLRQSFGLLTGIMRTFSTTGAGAADGTTVVSTTLSDEENDYYNGWWCYALPASPSYKRVSDFGVAAGVGTLTTAAFAAQIATSTECELWKYNPAYVEDAIKRALEFVYSRLYKPYQTTDLITGNHLRDGGLEEWSAATTMRFYAKTASLTLAQETTTKLFGTYAAKGTAGAATQYLYQSEVENPRLLDLAGHTVDFKGWAWTATASHARLQVVQTDKDGNATTTSSSYHAGDSRWHLLLVDDTAIDVDVRNLSFRLTAAVNAGISYYDQVRVIGPQLASYYLPRSGFQGIQMVELQQAQGVVSGGEDLDPCDDVGERDAFSPIKSHIDDNGTDKLLRFGGRLPNNYKLRLTGASLLTVPASDTATTELDSPRTEYLLAEAALRFFGTVPEGLPKEDIDRFAREQAKWLVVSERLRRQHEMMLPPSNLRY